MSITNQLFIQLAEKLNEKRLGFASEERLQKYLGLMPGCISVFGLINDKIMK